MTAKKMSKAVLISIKPEWCEKIIDGTKTVEIRKMKPRLETPFKVYIYCTKDGSLLTTDIPAKKVNGKVIGEFTCDRVIVFPYNANGYGLKDEKIICKTSRINAAELYHYLKGKIPYGWHISDLEIYDKPKELKEFNAICPYKKPDGTRENVDCPCDKYTHDFDEITGKIYCTRRITKPPQSWCYVEQEG